MLNKPEGFISSANDQFGRKTVFDLLPQAQEWAPLRGQGEAPAQAQNGAQAPARQLPQAQGEPPPQAPQQERGEAVAQAQGEALAQVQDGAQAPARQLPQSQCEAPVSAQASRLFSVGRLDCDTTGLLLLTNDGEFANRVAHPSGEIEKTYEAIVSQPPTQGMLERLRNGVQLGGGFVTSPARAWAGGAGEAGNKAAGPGTGTSEAGARGRAESYVAGGAGAGAAGASCAAGGGSDAGAVGAVGAVGAGGKAGSYGAGGYKVTVAIHEGKNRQVRRMLAAVGLRTRALKRVAIGGLGLGDLAEGSWRRISRDEAVLAIFGRWSGQQGEARQQGGARQ
ncbi:MAG: pseudouridine synthase [Clostridiales bacterium]|nr:pseudouridine synthase [Clostridiales bacterium]